MQHRVMINGLEAEFCGVTPPENTTLLDLLTRQKAVVANFDKGVVSLWGQASSDEDLQELERLLLLLPAVKGVDNHLEVAEPAGSQAAGEAPEDDSL